eukprot:CAMPEP_0115336648 /NCGR_PEP_ID=MMETSP0270-20121206/89115_1 /TAXON_ID=71861 /ORGANISM="Scrippsiella trochoidea, Strain CCMP3099" /LENGTH=50 /DNA_ID=CAMNT_0002757829 /DNA_START=205 /DNA_END=357 /DNA_ORIENTATION=-
MSLLLRGVAPERASPSASSTLSATSSSPAPAWKKTFTSPAMAPPSQQTPN